MDDERKKRIEKGKINTEATKPTKREARAVVGDAAMARVVPG